MDIDKLILKFTWLGKRLRILDTILKEKDQVREQTPLNYKTFYKSYSNQDCGICKGRNK